VIEGFSTVEKPQMPALASGDRPPA